MAGEELVERLAGLTAELERVEDPTARRVAEELSATVLELHGEGLGRLLEALSGGSALEGAVAGFFDQLRERSG
jgi:hypothetical protein